MHNPLLADLRNVGARVAILGGTFDPPHRGHVELAKTIVASGRAEKVLLIPARKNPLKASHPEASDQDRLEMLRLTAVSNEQLHISDLELKRPGDSFTVDTLRELKKQSPSSEFIFVCGADQLPNFHRWRDFKDVFALATIVMFGRAGVSRSEIDTLAPQLQTDHRIQIARNFMQFDSPVSSSEIRTCFADGRPDDARQFLDPGVFDYCIKNSLYQKKSESLK